MIANKTQNNYKLIKILHNSYYPLVVSSSETCKNIRFELSLDLTKSNAEKIQ